MRWPLWRVGCLRRLNCITGQAVLTFCISRFKTVCLKLFMIKGLNFTWREEDPGTMKILEGGTTFCWVYMQKFWSVWCSNREGVKDDRWQKDPSALFTAINNYLSAELSQLSACGNAKQNGEPLLLWLPTEWPAVYVLFVPSTLIFLVKAIYMELWSSYY